MKNKELIFLDQTVHSLKHHFVIGDLDKSSLQVVDSCERKHGGFDFDVGIIGASHYISLRTPIGLISEVVACIDINDTENVICNSVLLQDSSCLSMAPERAGIVYETSPPIIQEIDKSGDLITEYVALATLSTDPNVTGLIYEFPQGDLDYPPRTTVAVQIMDNSLIVSTMHEYPNEGMVAFTKNKFSKL